MAVRRTVIASCAVCWAVFGLSKSGRNWLLLGFVATGIRFTRRKYNKSRIHVEMW